MSATFAADLRESRRGCSALGRIPEDAPNGVYDVEVQPPHGAAFGVGRIEIKGGSDPLPAEASVEPASGPLGTQFTIFDPQGRMQPTDVCVIYPDGETPDNGIVIADAVITPTSVTGTIPQVGVAPLGVQYLRVAESPLGYPRFTDLLFLVEA
jgi:hypothetical protein